MNNQDHTTNPTTNPTMNPTANLFLSIFGAGGVAAYWETELAEDWDSATASTSRSGSIQDMLGELLQWDSPLSSLLPPNRNRLLEVNREIAQDGYFSECPICYEAWTD